jgi:hypothetical protein
VEVLVFAVSVLTYAHDDDVSVLLLHAGTSPPEWTLAPYERLGPHRREARAVKARYVGVCRGCGAYTQPRNGKGDAYAYCKACHPGAIERRWSRGRVTEAMRSWEAR